MAAFYAITCDEFEGFLLPLGFQRLTGEGNVYEKAGKENPLGHIGEFVYGKRVPNSCDGMPLTVRVYSGIEIRDGKSREIGSDAIRVCMVGQRDDDKIVGVAKDRRVNRVAGWKNNLANRLRDFDTIECCDKCGAPMRVRKGKNGEFLGCSNYGHPTNSCSNTKSL